MGSAGCRAARLKSQSAMLTAMLQNPRRHLLPPWASLRSGARFWTSVWLMPPGLGRFELGAVSQHGMHDNGETASKSDPCRVRCGPFGDSDCPVLELQRPLVARQHDVGGLVQKCADTSITALRDAAGVVDFAGLITPRHQAEISPDVARSPEASGIIDCGGECERGQLADTGNAHQPAAGVGCPDHSSYVAIDGYDRSEHGRTGGNQTPHGGGQARNAVARLQRLPDEVGAQG